MNLWILSYLDQIELTLHPAKYLSPLKPFNILLFYKHKLKYPFMGLYVAKCALAKWDQMYTFWLTCQMRWYVVER